MVVRNRKKTSSTTAADDEDDPRCAVLQSWNATDLELVDARWLASMRELSSPLSDLISQPGSEVDEVVSVSAASSAVLQEEGAGPCKGLEAGQGSQGQEDGDGSLAEAGPAEYPTLGPQLSALLADTPAARLALLKKHAAELQKAGNLQGLLQLRRQILGVAKVAQALWSVLPEDEDALALSTAHYDLALAYADIGYGPQAVDQCRWAAEELPKFEHPMQVPQRAVQLQRDVQLLHGEVLMNGVKPRVKEALQCFLAADGATSVQEVQDMSVRVLCCQCLTLLGVARLQEAQATRAAFLKLQDELQLLREKAEAALERAEKAKENSNVPVILSTFAGKVVVDEYKTAKRKNRAAEEQRQYEEQWKLLVAAEEEAEAELELESDLTNKAEELLNSSMENLFDVTQAEENRLRANSGYSASITHHPLVAKLYRQLAFIGMNLAAVYGMIGPTKRKEQIRCLEEILINHRAYEGLLPHPLVAKTYRELGAVLMEDKQYEKAHKSNEDFFELQEGEFSGRPACLDVARAECYKLKGNIFVAQTQLHRASEMYEQALKLFSSRLGQGDQLVLDLEHRLSELKEYTGGPEL